MPESLAKPAGSAASTSSSTVNSVAAVSPQKMIQRGESLESFDLAGDPDLEARLSNPSPPVATVPSEKSAEKAGSATRPAPPGPATLSHDDPKNPRNWSTAKKVTIDIVLCVWVLTLTYNSTAYVGSLAALEHRFHMSEEVALLGVSLSVFGFAAGPLVAGPSSELFGRRLVYTVTAICYSAFMFATAFSPNTTALLLFRFLAGFFGSSSINNVPASIGDITTPANRNQYTILYALNAFGGPALGPLCASFIEAKANWEWNLRVMAIFSTAVSILVCFVPETHGPTLMKWRIKKEGKAPPALTAGQIISVYKTALARPVVYLFTEPTVTMVSIYLSTLYGILYGFFEAFSIVYVEIRGFSSTSYGLTYIALGLGTVTLTSTNDRTDLRKLHTRS